VSVFRSGNHWGVTIVREGDDASCCHRGVRHPGHRHGELVAVVVNGDQELAERICALLNASDGVAAQCTEDTWSWEHFNDQQTDGYWITCDRTGPHDEHKDEHTGLTWRTEVRP